MARQQNAPFFNLYINSEPERRISGRYCGAYLDGFKGLKEGVLCCCFCMRGTEGCCIGEESGVGSYRRRGMSISIFSEEIKEE